MGNVSDEILRTRAMFSPRDSHFTDAGWGLMVIPTRD